MRNAISSKSAQQFCAGECIKSKCSRSTDFSQNRKRSKQKPARNTFGRVFIQHLNGILFHIFVFNAGDFHPLSIFNA